MLNVFQNIDSPQRNPGSGLSQEAEQLLSAMTKNTDPDVLASVLAQSSNTSALEELMGRLQPAKESGPDLSVTTERGSQENADLSQLLSLVAEAVSQPVDKKKSFVDIEDEEKFLYGDEEEESSPVKGVPKAGQSSLLDVYGETSADVALYQEAKVAVMQPRDLQKNEYGASPYIHELPKEDVVSHSKRESKHQDKHCSSGQSEKTANEEPGKFPPGIGPSDVKVRQEVEEYEKIQDLLKTIGLDLGVAEISKMAARTQERLHGKNPVKKPPARRQSDRKHKSRSRSYSSTSSSSRSRSSSRSNSYSRSRSSSSHERTQRRKKLVGPETRFSRSVSDVQREGRSGIKIEDNSWTNAGPQTPEIVGSGTSSFPGQTGHSAHQMPPYSHQHQHGVMPPNYHPPGYDPYGNYMPYIPQAWPMYPPPSMTVPPHSPMDNYSAPATERPFLKVIDTGSNEKQESDKKGE